MSAGPSSSQMAATPTDPLRPAQSDRPNVREAADNFFATRRESARRALGATLATRPVVVSAPPNAGGRLTPVL